MKTKFVKMMALLIASVLTISSTVLAAPEDSVQYGYFIGSYDLYLDENQTQPFMNTEYGYQRSISSGNIVKVVSINGTVVGIDIDGSIYYVNYLNQDDFKLVKIDQTEDGLVNGWNYNPNATFPSSTLLNDSALLDNDFQRKDTRTNPYYAGLRAYMEQCCQADEKNMGNPNIEALDLYMACYLYSDTNMQDLKDALGNLIIDFADAHPYWMKQCFGILETDLELDNKIFGIALY